MTPSISGTNKWLRAAGALVFWFAVWALASYRVGQALILPAPVDVAARLAALAATGPFWLNTGTSLLNVFFGFTAGVLAGTVLAFLTAFNKVLDALLSPALRVIRATPVASFIILALLWLGKARVPAFASALMVTPVVWQSVTAALYDTDRALLEMAKMYRFGAVKTLKLIYLPSIKSQWGAACATAMGLAWKSGIAAEVICQTHTTVGEALYNSKVYLETTDLFAWTVVVVCLSLLLENVLARTVVRGTGRRGK